MKYEFVVADSSPIIIFAKTVGLQAMGHFATQILAPSGVISECTALADKGGAEEVHKAIASGFIKEVERVDVSGLPASALLLLGNDGQKNFGEKEALCLAKKLSLPLIVDDEKARQAARILGLDYVGSCRILLEAWKAGAFTEELPEILDQWAQNKFFLAKSVRETIENLARQHQTKKPPPVQ